MSETSNVRCGVRRNYGTADQPLQILRDHKVELYWRPAFDLRHLRTARGPRLLGRWATHGLCGPSASVADHQRSTLATGRRTPRPGVRGRRVGRCAPIKRTGRPPVKPTAGILVTIT